MSLSKKDFKNVKKAILVDEVIRLNTLLATTGLGTKELPKSKPRQRKTPAKPATSCKSNVMTLAKAIRPLKPSFMEKGGWALTVQVASVLKSQCDEKQLDRLLAGQGTDADITPAVIKAASERMSTKKKKLTIVTKPQVATVIARPLSPGARPPEE